MTNYKWQWIKTKFGNFILIIAFNIWKYEQNTFLQREKIW